MLTLYGHDPSPYVRRVRVLLVELAIPFTRETRGWIDPAPEFVAASPILRLPMLDRGAGHSVRYVYDSRVIAETLYETPHAAPGGTPPFQGTLWSVGLEAADKNVASAAEAVLDSLVSVFLLGNDGVSPEQSPYLRRQVDRARGCLAWLDGVYAGRTTLTDGVLAFADVSVVCALGWIRFRKRMDLAPYEALLAMESAHAGRPSFRETAPR